jgi:DNA-binding NarL/FixJ family response regulator
VDDHPLFCDGITQLVNRQPDLVICGEAETVRDAIAAVESLKPHLVITDITLKGNSGLELIKSLHAMFPELPVLALSMHEESLYAERAVRAGARGYVMKQEASERILTAIGEVLGGAPYVSDMLNTVLIRKLAKGPPPDGKSPVSKLSDRELEIFHLIGQGVGTRQIAVELTIGVKTVETHRSNIKKKLGLKSAPELIRFAVEWSGSAKG